MERDLDALRERLEYAESDLRLMRDRVKEERAPGHMLASLDKALRSMERVNYHLLEARQGPLSVRAATVEPGPEEQET